VKALVQRVSRAAVRVLDREVAAIGPGMLVLVGVEIGDGEADADRLAKRTAHLRVFADPDGRMNLDVVQVGGAALVVSQFTLAASTRRGRRPSYERAAEPETAERLYLRFAEGLRRAGVPTCTGVFRAMMEVELVNDGPVTILLASGQGERGDHG